MTDEAASQDTDLRDDWDNRARDQGTQLRSVLYVGLSEPINRLIHRWQVGVIEGHLLPHLPRGARVLDLGCGYGRVSEAMQAARPDLEIVGLDYSLNFCQLAAGRGHRVLCADVNALPLPEDRFDGIVGVTVLMYLRQQGMPALLGYLARYLKPGGCGIFIDPGQEYIDFIRRLNPASRRRTTGGQGGSREEYTGLGSNPELEILGSGGCGRLALAVPLWQLLAKLTAATPLGETLLARDIKAEHPGRLDMQRWVAIRRPATANPPS